MHELLYFSPPAVIRVGVVVRGEQVPREDLGVLDVQVTSMGSNVQVSGAVTCLPPCKTRVPGHIHNRKDLGHYKNTCGGSGPGEFFF